MASLSFKSVVTALTVTVWFSIPGASIAGPGSERSDELLERLATAEDDVAAGKVERDAQHHVVPGVISVAQASTIVLRHRVGEHYLRGHVGT